MRRNQGHTSPGQPCNRCVTGSQKQRKNEKATPRTSRRRVAFLSSRRGSLTSLPNLRYKNKQDLGELAHAHATTAEACACAERSGSGYVADRVTAHVAAAVAAARCHRANATKALAPDPEAGFATPWDVLALEDHLEDAAGAALAAEDDTTNKQETGPGLEPCVESKSPKTESRKENAISWGVSLRVATLGGRCAAASALNDADAAFDAACDIFSQLEHAEWASCEKTGGGWDAFARGVADAPHGAAVASALKFAGHWAALRGAGVLASHLNGDATHADTSDTHRYRVAMRAYDRAEALAKAVASSSAPEAAAAALAADELVADVALAKAQLSLRSAVANLERGEGRDLSPEEKALLSDAEAAAAAAVTAAEATGDPEHPRVGVAVACSADVYVAKAVLAAKGKGGVGDGAGVLFADGLYRNALRRFGTARPPTSVASDPDAAAGGAAPAHLRLVAAFAHAKYAAVLRASGANRANEAEAWSNAALKEWDDDFSERTKSEDVVPRENGGDARDSRGEEDAIRNAAGGIGSVGKTRAILDGQLMMPVVG